jgi:hypothetical protein
VCVTVVLWERVLELCESRIFVECLKMNVLVMLAKEKRVLLTWIDWIVAGKFARVRVQLHEHEYTFLEKMVHLVVTCRTLKDA